MPSSGGTDTESGTGAETGTGADTGTAGVAAASGPGRQGRPAWWRRLVAGAVAGVAVAWLLFVVAHRLLSGRVWWWILPDLTPPLLFAVVPAMLLAVVPLARPRPRVRSGPHGGFRRARIAPLALASLLLASLAIGWPATGLHPAALWHRPGPVPPGTVTVFSWNTFYWDQLTGGWATPGPDGRPARDPDLFYRHLRDQRADIYLLQEYLYFEEGWDPVRIDDPERLRREFPDFHIAAVGELVTVSRFPIVLERPLDLRPWLAGPPTDLPPEGTRMPDYYTVKTLRTDVRIAGRVVSLYNSHATLPVVGRNAVDPGSFGENRFAQDVRRANFRAVAADVATNPHPILLAGDLNTSPAMGLLRALPERLVDAVAATDRVYPASWSWRGIPLWRLDWVFTTTDLEVHRYRMVPADDLSDHRGQHLTISVPAPPAP